MRPSPGIAFALAVLVSSSGSAQAALSQAAAPQTARQALIEMFFGQAANHLEKHLPEVTRQAFESLEENNGQSVLGAFSMLSKQVKEGKEKIETFDTGSTLFTLSGLPAGSYDKMEITVERDDLANDEDQIELAVRMTRGGKDEVLPVIPRFTFSMKMESDVWRLNEISVAVRFPLADPDFLNGILKRQRSQNEQMAIWSMRSLFSAEKSYQSSNGAFACSLSALGTTGKESGSAGHRYLYDSQLASGKKNGYVFAISACDNSHYQLAAEPALPASVQRAFCADESGTVRVSADGKAATCLSSGEVVEKVPAVGVSLGAASHGNAVSGTTQPGQRVRISQGVSQGLLVEKVPPVYPPEARSSRIQGTILMNAVISKTGDVASVDLISGHPLLAPAAMDAVKQWKYRPYLLNGNAVEVETQITVNFTLH